MSTSITFNGSSYIIPAVGDAGWGANVSSYLTAIPSGALQKTGGAFTLSAADVQFGASYGLQAIYYKSNSATIAQSGVLRLANADVLAWRNGANNADLALSVNGSGQLVWNGSVLATVAAGLVPPSEGGTGVNNGGTLTWGSSNVTFTTTGATTVTLPTAGTLATLAGTEAPTNKTFDSTSTMTGVKIASFTPDGTHTLTAPTATDTLVGKATTDTLTNKTISCASNTFSNIPNSATTAASAATASAIMARDSNANVAINNINEAFATTATAAGTTTLTVSSAPLQQFTGTTTQTVKLPDATTLPTGCQFYVFNRSTGAVTVKDGGNTTIQTLSGGNQACFTCAANGTTAGTWDLTVTYTGTLPIAQGGTGQTTANAALNALLPTQTGNSGKVLSTDGSNTSWAAGLTTTLTSAHLFIGNGSNVATDTAVTGDVTISNSGVTTLASSISGVKTFSSGVVLPTSGSGTGTGVSGSSTTLDFYETVTFTSNFVGNGAGSTAASQSLQITRVGKVVTIMFGSWTVTCAASSTLISNSTALPTRFQPNGAVIIPIAGITSGGSNTAGGIIQVNGGTINIYKDWANTAFTNGGCGPVQAIITYAVA